MVEVGGERAGDRFNEEVCKGGREGVRREGGVEGEMVTAAGTGEGAGTRLECFKHLVVQPFSSLIKTLTFVGVKLTSLQVK